MLKTNTSSNEVTLHKDGSWSPLLPKKERPEPEVEKKKANVVAIETLSDSDDDEVSPSAPTYKVVDGKFNTLFLKVSSQFITVFIIFSTADNCFGLLIQ